MKFTFKTLKLNGDDSSRIIYYDVTCNLCNGTIKFIKRFDKHNTFEYVPLQYSDFKRETTVIYKEKNIIYRKSDAVLLILKNLPAPVSWLYGFIIIPRFIRDWIYEIISRNRHKWFGRSDTCELNYGSGTK